MSEYMLHPATLLFSSLSEAKEKRRKVLEEVRARRKIIYARYRKKVSTPSLSPPVSLFPLEF